MYLKVFKSRKCARGRICCTRGYLFKRYLIKIMILKNHVTRFYLSLILNIQRSRDWRHSRPPCFWLLSPKNQMSFFCGTNRGFSPSRKRCIWRASSRTYLIISLLAFVSTAMWSAVLRCGRQTQFTSAPRSIKVWTASSWNKQRGGFWLNLAL